MTDPRSRLSAPVALQLEGVSLDIPVFTNETRSLKASLIRSVTGGSLRRRRGGAVVTALQDINCTIHEGERIALIGHNGAGKSTFLRLISGIYQPTAGLFRAKVPVFPMIHKSFITSPELSGLQAIKAHYLLVHGSLRGFEAFQGSGSFRALPRYGWHPAARLPHRALVGAFLQPRFGVQGRPHRL